MARPRKNTAEYFPHYVADSRTKFVLEDGWGNDGYAFWFKLLEVLCKADGHAYDCSERGNKRYLVAYARIEEEVVDAILSALVDLGKIDRDLWEKRQIIWCQGLVDNLSPLYGKRSVSGPEKPLLEEFPGRKLKETDQSVAETPQSRVKIEKRKDIGSKDPCRVVTEKPALAEEIVAFLNLTIGTSYRASSKKTISFINARLKDGFTLEDFKVVITKKATEWANRPDMAPYLRPETLFGPKFEGYLNQPDPRPQSGMMQKLIDAARTKEAVVDASQ